MNNFSNSEWNSTVKKFESLFGEDLDLKSILFLIGLQELGKGELKLNKNQKMEVMHIAVCKLLSHYGFYDFVGIDKDGWPHYSRTKKLPALNPIEQEKLIQQAIIFYAENELS